MAGEILDCSSLINQEVISSHETPEVQILRVSSSKIEGMAQDSLSEILWLFDDVKKFDWIDSPIAASEWGKRWLINMKWEYISDLRFDDIVEAFKYDNKVYFCVLLWDKYLLIDNEWKIFNFHVFDSIDEAYDWLKSYKSDSRFAYEKFRPGNIELIVEANPSLGNKVVEWLSTDSENVDRVMILKELKTIKWVDKDKCKCVLESVLPENICKLLFWYNFDNVLNSTFSWYDLYNYVTTNYSENYLRSTDFWCDLANKNIYINSNSKVWDWKFLLSLCKRIQRWSDEVRINIPFEKISSRSDYKLNKDNIKIEYLWNDDLDEHIVRLIELLKATWKYYMVPSVDRKLWIFWVNEEKNDKNSD